MQISQLKKLLLPIKELTSRRAKRSSAETSEPKEENEVQSAECRVQNAEQMQSAECRVQNQEAEYENAYEPSDNCLEDMPIEADPTPEAPKVNTKAHLSSSVPRAAKLPLGALTKGQMAEIREIFGDIDDAEIQRLYKRVTKQ